MLLGYLAVDAYFYIYTLLKFQVKQETFLCVDTSIIIFLKSIDLRDSFTTKKDAEKKRDRHTETERPLDMRSMHVNLKSSDEHGKKIGKSTKRLSFFFS